MQQAKILQQNIKAQPGSRAHFLAIYQSRPIAKYQSQPIKVSSIIENHRLRSDEPKSTQTSGYNYYYKATNKQDNNQLSLALSM
jgi:hypothetical protein